jgi:hypothetical protein
MTGDPHYADEIATLRGMTLGHGTTTMGDAFRVEETDFPSEGQAPQFHDWVDGTWQSAAFGLGFAPRVNTADGADRLGG